jgi:non-canonical purine NTP pyrophosphatase (RdgB/HAM1 family)
MQLLIATTNPGKKDEFISLLESSGIDLKFPDGLGIRMEVEETGKTYKANALLKAETLCRLSGLPTLADDTGLEVVLLGGRPGLYSARYARASVNSDAGRRSELLKELSVFARPWQARFACVAALAFPSKPSICFDGEVTGEIIPEERGNFGFGYDRIFFIPQVNKTMAELDLIEKNTLSHRAIAVNQVRNFLQAMS